MQYLSFILKRLALSLVFTAIIFAIISFWLKVPPQDFLNNSKYWIIPLGVAYFIINFERLFHSILSKIIFMGILIWSGYTYFPSLMKYVEPYVGHYTKDIIGTDKLLSSANKFINEQKSSSGKQPIEERKKENLIIQEQQEKEEAAQKTIAESISVDFTGVPRDEIAEKIQKLPPKDLDALAKMPLKQVSEIVQMAPVEVQNKLYQMGFNANDPLASIQQIVGKNKDQQRSAIKNLFK